MQQGKWTKSTFSVESNCVEVMKTDGGFRVRDSKNPNGPELAFTDAEWQAFVAGANDGQFSA